MISALAFAADRSCRLGESATTAAIEYLRAENRVLREQLGKRRLLLTDDQRRFLAEKGKAAGRNLLAEIGTLFHPETILRWHRELIARKFDCSDRRRSVGRPWVRQEIVDFTVQIARENTSWATTAFKGRFPTLVITSARPPCATSFAATALNRLQAANAGSLGRRSSKPIGTVSPPLISSQWKYWTPHGLVTFYGLILIELKTRRIHIAGMTTNPHTQWMQQIARTLTDPFDGFLRPGSALLIDRDTKFSTPFAPRSRIAASARSNCHLVRPISRAMLHVAPHRFG